MSPEESENGTPSPDVETDESPDEESFQKMQELLGELRAEITRLKANRAKERAQNWIQRHPMLAVTLSSALGAAAGYGAAVATRPAPPTLSEQARRRLRRLADEARRVAGDVGRELTQRAAQSGEKARERARETGRRLAQEARAVGESAQREAQGLARRASERAQRAGTDAGETLRRAAREATRRVREGRESASEEAREFADEASEAVETQAEAVKEAVSTADTSRLKRSLWTIAGLTAGGLLAAKLRRWL